MARAIGIGLTIPEVANRLSGPVAPTAYLRHVTSPTYWMTDLAAASTTQMTRKAFITRDAVTSLQLGYSNSCLSTTTLGEQGAGQSLPMQVWIEYPAGTYNAVSRSASTSITLANGEDALMDALSISIPINTLFWVWTYAIGRAPCTLAGMTGFLNSAQGEGCIIATSGVPTAPSGTKPGTTSQCGFSPCVILGMTAKDAVLAIGDSHVAAKNDQTNSNLDRSYIGRSIGGNNIAYANFGCSSDSAGSAIFPDGVLGVAHRQFWYQYFNVFQVQLGLNDAASASDLATVRAYLQRFMSRFNGKRVIRNTYLPYTASDSVTPANPGDTILTALNQNDIRGGALPYIEISDLGSSARDSGVWKSTSYTVDGSHPKDPTTYALVSDVSGCATAIAAALPATGLTWTPVITNISPTFGTTSPKFGTASLTAGGLNTNGLSPGGNAAFTICFWAKQTTGNAATMIGKSSFNVSVTVAGVITALLGSSGQSITGTGTNLLGGSWHHIAIVSTATSATLYFDGSSVGTSATLRPNLGSSPSRQFGIRGAGSTSPTTITNNANDPAIDEFTIWNYAMSGTQVAAEAAASSAHTGTETGLVALMHLNDATVILGPGA